MTADHRWLTASTPRRRYERFTGMRKSKMVAKKGMKVRVPTSSGLARFILGPLGRTLLIAGAVFTILGFGVFTYFYLVYAPLIDKKLGEGPIANTAKIFAAPEAVAVGDTSTPRGCRRRPPPQRLYRIPQQSNRLLPDLPRRHRSLPRDRTLISTRKPA